MSKTSTNRSAIHVKAKVVFYAFAPKSVTNNSLCS